MQADWFAGVREHRLFMVVAIAGMLFIALLLIAPSWFIPQHAAKNHRNTQAHPPLHKLQPKPTHASASHSRNVVKRVHPASASRQTGKKLSHGYYIQIGAFKNAAGAKKVAASLKRTGWHVQTIVKKNKLHTVIIGAWPTRKRALAAKQKLAHQHHLQGFLITSQKATQ